MVIQLRGLGNPSSIINFKIFFLMHFSSNLYEVMYIITSSDILKISVNYFCVLEFIKNKNENLMYLFEKTFLVQSFWRDSTLRHLNQFWNDYCDYFTFGWSLQFCFKCLKGTLKGEYFKNNRRKKKNTPENKLIRDKKIITCTEIGL